MSSIFPIRDTVSRDPEREPRLVDLDEETADEVFDALSSRTTREIFLTLHTTPQTTSDLADATDTSVQNVQYHLRKLTDAELVEVVDTWYSERGTEMKVYAPKDGSLVLFAGRDKQGTLRSLLNRVVGVFSLLLPVSLLAGFAARLTTGTDGEDGPPEVIVGGEDAETQVGDSADDTDVGIQAEPDDGAGIQAEPDDGVGIQAEPDDDAGVQAEPDELFDTAQFDGSETVIMDEETTYIVDDETTLAVENATVTTGDGSSDGAAIATQPDSFVIEGDAVEPGSTVSVSDAFTVDESGEITFSVDDEAQAVEEATITAPTETESDLAAETDPNEPALVIEGEVTEPGSNVTLPVEVIERATDTTATVAGLDPALAVAVGVFLGGLTVAGGLAAWYGVSGWTRTPDETSR